jgi:F0F1-type ATP synthase membrane subunit b/b'
MTTAIFVILVIVVSVFVMQPLLQSKNKSRQKKISSNHVAGDLLERKETVYAAIKEIEFDYQMGKLSEEDYNSLRQQYKDEAVSILKKLDTFQSQKSHKSGSKKSTAATVFCSQCGNKVVKTDKFCSSCGSKI